MKRLDFTFIAAMLILALSTYNAIDDSLEDDRDENFYGEVFKFMSRGDRNTAAMGYALCMRQNKQEERHDIPATDCCKIYYPNKTDCNTP